MTQHDQDVAQRTGAIAARAVQTFGSPRDALEWLCESQGVFGGVAPVDLIGTEREDEVITILGRLDHGVYT